MSSPARGFATNPDPVSQTLACAIPTAVTFGRQAIITEERKNATIQCVDQVGFHRLFYLTA